jgi:RNA-binding protein
MAITGKQVRQLRSMANNLKPLLQVGKDGVTNNVLNQIEADLEAHELIKVSVLCETGSQAAEAGRTMADETGAELIQVIGKRVVLYRETSREDVEKIQLVK